ncbi:GIY-YIG nuclease family protein [bacterium]|nr:GIY-YIG nuclease family protein [bacterium]
MLTYKNHDGKAAKYDMISLFSLRPPELLGVFRNPVDYYRYCYIDDKTLNEKKVEDMLVPDLYQCPWIDCLGRRVKIRGLALNDVSELVERNLRVLDESNAELSDAQTFAREVNMVICKIVAVHQSSVEDLDAEDSLWLEEQVPNFIHCDNSDNLPIPILSNTSPLNALQFLTHIILSLGEYNTEIDALTHATSRDCLRAAGLIGNATDQESLQRYSNELGRKYVEEQVVFYPNSLTKSETFIVTAQKVLDDAIVHNALSINELPPFTMSSLRVEKTAENEQLWTDHKTSQLQSVYNTLNNTQGIPSKEDVLAAERDSPLQWDPLETVVRYEHQSNESFEEQQLAIELNVKQIKKYRNISGIESVTYTKNPVVYGAPGTGKSFVGQLIVLYAISQGLNIISTALMGARANALGGIHIHKLFPLPVDRGSSMSPFKLAQEALGKITRKPDLMFLIRTMDAIFLDEAATVSAEILSALDIILRVERKSQIPFGGILILGTMDPTQIQPINQLPFLTSSLMLTCFLMVELKCSVRAHGDTDFQRLQAIIRMNPFVLMTPNTPMTSEQIAIKEEFFELAGRVLTFVPNWSDPRISPNMMRVFSRVRPAQEALDDYRESIKQQLINDGTDHHLAISRDVQKAQQTNTDSYRQASEQSVKTLNKELKEPSELVLFAGGVYECTINDPSGRFCYSQLAFMLDLPSRDDVINFNSIAMWIAPGGLQHIEYDQNNMPTRQQLLDAEWKEVRIGCASERLVSVRGGLQAKRLQYALKHIGAVTINKSQGATLPAGLAVEITEEYSPWESGQIVVLSSRTTIGSRTLVVGNKNFAINKMWELITQGNQWTRYTEHVLDLISINGNSRSGSNTTQNDHRVLFDYPSVYPFRMCDAIIPTDTTGYVYCLVSKRNPGKIYIGETTCLSQRVINHNSGNGAQDTEDVRDWPWTPAAYICGLGHMTTSDRRSLERSWKQHIADLCRRGQRDSYTWIRSGARVVDIHNSGADDEKIRFILCITAETANANNT